MEAALALTIGALYAMAFYLMLRRSVVRLIFGLMLFGQAVNLLIFASGGLTREKSAIIAAGASTLEGPYADPLPQALILTAIVIGFGVLAFCVALVYRAFRDYGTDDLAKLKDNAEK